jgi:hypothetical protein
VRIEEKSDKRRMLIVSEKVRVEYRTEQDHCKCCGHKLEKPKTSEIREFYLSKDDCFDWLDEENWKIEAEDEEELQQMVEEFVYESISFFATSSYEVIHIERSELAKVKQFILEKVVS